MTDSDPPEDGKIPAIGEIIRWGSDQQRMHRRVSWMRGADDAVIRLLNQCNLELPPGAIAHNLGYNKDYMATRCRDLAKKGLLSREGNGGPYYGLSSLGMQYAAGELLVEDLEELAEEDEE